MTTHELKTSDASVDMLLMNLCDASVDSHSIRRLWHLQWLEEGGMWTGNPELA